MEELLVPLQLLSPDRHRQDHHATELQQMSCGIEGHEKLGEQKRLQGNAKHKRRKRENDSRKELLALVMMLQEEQQPEDPQTHLRNHIILRDLLLSQELLQDGKRISLPRQPLDPSDQGNQQAHLESYRRTRNEIGPKLTIN